jgi:signal transduction histidine kinase
MALVNAYQTIEVLRSQLQSGRADLPFFEKRLEDIAKVIQETQEDRKTTGQQERVAKLYEVSRVIGSSLDLQTVLDQVMDAIIQLTLAERGFLMLVDDDGALKVQVARNFDQENVSAESFALSRTVTSRVMESGESIVTTNAQEDPRFASAHSIVSQALRSIMVAPLRARGNIIGVVYVDNRLKSGLFSEADLDMLQAFAGQAAVAIDNARLFSATDKALAARVEELTMLRWIDRQLSETLDLNRMLQLTLEWSMRVCHAERGGVFVLAPETKVWQAAIYRGDDAQGLPQGTPLSADMPYFGAIGQAIETQDLVLQEHLTAGDETLLCVPVRRENQVVGVVFMLSTRSDAFDEASREFAERVADRAAVALENGRLYQAVRSANAAKSEFVSVVAHELKLPMTSINGYADLLKMAGPVTEKQEQFVVTIKNAVNRMKVLVSDLSDISRLETGNLRIEMGPVNVNAVVDAAIEGTMTEIGRRQHNLLVHVEKDLPHVLADRDRLTQILLNLISNAYKYTPDGGTIRVLVEQTAVGISFSVSDSGVGMTPEQVAMLGTKFWRADNGLGQPGTGLGFAITRNLIEMMSGKLQIQSVPGQGSTFEFTLPSAAGQI